MPHTYSNLLIHFVFSTKERRKLTPGDIQLELYAYLGGLVKELKGARLKIHGTSDHVHMLIILPPTVNASDAMRFIKTNSSKWISKRLGVPFAWQTGYGAFSVSWSNADAVIKYIENQEQHHNKFD